MLREYQHVSIFGMTSWRGAVQIWIENDCDEADKYPWPGTQRVMRNVEPQHGEQSLLLVFGAKDALSDVSAAAGLSSGIPERPPLQSEKDKQRDHGKSPPSFCS